MAQKIFIDTDCGIDDAVAIMLALSSPEEVEITGISCVAGNTSLDNVVKNVCGLLSFFNRADIPVYRGCSSSFLRNTHRSDHIHGGNGLGGVELDPRGKTVDGLNAASGLLESAKADPGLKLVTLGPLTNIATAFNLYPELNSLVSEIIIMGGAIGEGNVTPFAEFNFFFDPESVARTVSVSSCRSESSHGMQRFRLRSPKRNIKISGLMELPLRIFLPISCIFTLISGRRFPGKGLSISLIPLQWPV